MSKLDEIMTTPTIGLLPYLEDQLGADFNRLQARPYNFGSKSGQAGFRYRDRIGTPMSSSPHSPKRVQQTIAIGKLLKITGNDASAMTEALNLISAMEGAILDWFSCKCPGLESISPIRSSPPIEPNSQETNSWCVAVQLTFELTYIE